MKLKAKAKDPFAAQRRIYTINWVLASLLGLCVMALMVLVYVIVAVVMRPPTVIVKDHVNGCAPEIVTASTQRAVSDMDAKVFLIEVLKRRTQWTSANVHESLKTYLSYSTEHHRKAIKQYLHERIPLDPKNPDSKLPREEVWIKSMIRRTLVLPKTMDRIECTQASADAMDDAWHCQTKATILTSPLLGSDTAGEPETVMVVATFLELSRTFTSHPHGLLVGAMEFHPIDDDLM